MLGYSTRVTVLLIAALNGDRAGTFRLSDDISLLARSLG